MNDVVVLPNIPTDHTAGFVTDCCRAGEGLCSDRDVQAKYELSDQAWTEIAKSPALGRAVRTEAEKRVRNGVAAKESAARHFAKAPDTLNSLLTDKTVSPRYRIESAKELRAVATGSDSSTPAVDASEKFVITINMGTDRIEHYELPVMKQLPPKDPDWGWSELDRIDK
jgi:hypothetical protein